MNVNIHFTDASKAGMNRAFSSLKRATYSGAWNMINRLAMYTAGSASRAARISAVSYTHLTLPTILRV